jgi:folate-binding protein YgfZ
MLPVPPPLRSWPPIAWASLAGRSALLARGPDAVRFVDNFTTAAVSALPQGGGSEGFFTDARGHVLALANILRTADGLWLDAAAGVAASLRSHLDHYLIRERVEFVDASADRTAFLLIGPAAAGWLTAHADGAVPTGILHHAPLRIDGVAANVVALDWFGPDGLLLEVAADAAPQVAARLRAAGLPELDAPAVDAARIEAGSPEPADIDAKTLPQELGRDARAISFTKGCYLGQETVARLDALGHVNRRLVVLAAAEPPAVGAAVTAGGETVGTISSACPSPRLGGGLGLALVRVRALEGAALEVAGRPVRAIDPPAAATHRGA